MFAFWQESYDKPRQCDKKQSDYSADKGPYSQSYGLPSGHSPVPTGRRHRGIAALALEDKYDDIKKLIDAGKEKGYLTYSEVNDLIPHEDRKSTRLNPVTTTIG